MILTASKTEQTRFGKRYGYLPKKPLEEKTEENPSVGFASKPPMAATGRQLKFLPLKLKLEKRLTWSNYGSN